MNGLRENCHCGHDKASHYLDREAMPPQHSTCLARGCETCRQYVNEFEPKPKVTSERPHHATWCRCFRCKDFVK